MEVRLGVVGLDLRGFLEGEFADFVLLEVGFVGCLNTGSLRFACLICCFLVWVLRFRANLRFLGWVAFPYWLFLGNL